MKLYLFLDEICTIERESFYNLLNHVTFMTSSRYIY